MAKEKPDVSTGFEEPAVVPKKKRYSPTMEAIHAVERTLAKLTPAEQKAVYLHLRNIWQPELSFFVVPPQ